MSGKRFRRRAARDNIAGNFCGEDGSGEEDGSGVTTEQPAEMARTITLRACRPEKEAKRAKLIQHPEWEAKSRANLEISRLKRPRDAAGRCADACPANAALPHCTVTLLP